MTTFASHPALIEGLRAAVPLWMMQLATHDPDTRDRIRMKWARDAVEPVASRADALQFGGKRGEAAEVFNHLARALAALAYAPGGVTFAGIHWCADHQLCLDVEAGIIRLGPALSDDEWARRLIETITPVGGVL